MKHMDLAVVNHTLTDFSGTSTVTMPRRGMYDGMMHNLYGSSKHTQTHVRVVKVLESGFYFDNAYFISPEYTQELETLLSQLVDKK